MDNNQPSPLNTPRRPRRGLTALALSGALIAVTGLSTAGVAHAATPHTTDVITYTSHAYLTPPGAGPGRFVVVGDTCSLESDGGPAIPCTVVGYGTVTPTGGTGRAIVTSRRGVIVLDETYEFTSPTTLVGKGNATEIRGGERLTGTWIGYFVATPTAVPNVLLDSGVMTVTH